LLYITIILVIVGLGAGMIGSMIGVGGGILMTPALTFMGFTPTHIASTSLIAITSTSISSTVEYSKQKRIDYGLGLKMAALSTPGAIIGAFLSSGISLEHFKLYFAIILIFTGLYIVYRNTILKEKPDAKPKSMFFYMGSFTAGIVSSFFGIGGGIIFVPMMIILLRMTMFIAGPTSQLTLLITSFVGVITHAILGHPDYIQGISLAAGAFIGGQIGARLSGYLRESILQNLLSVTLIGVALKLLFDFMNKK
jgi:uncharacterized protein